jgi:hypothetical protein
MAENDNEKESGDTDKDSRVLYTEDEQESGIFRWMSAFVVLLAVAGFFGLAWYAYKSGGEAVDEKDVELVKADKAPVKETPANPGGMQIPNQDKTVYGLIGGNKAEKPTVERILPAPEEPIARGGDTTETWMSDKAKNKVNGEEGAEKIAEATPPVPAIETTPSEVKKTEQFNPAQVQTAQNDQGNVTPQEVQPKSGDSVVTKAAVNPVVTVAPATTPAPAPEVKKEVKKEAPPPPPEKKTPVAAAEPEPKAAVKPPIKGARVQLGAYKSEEEAENNWTKIAKRFENEMNGKAHYIIRADLGEKGIYYRLQVAPFASAKAAEEFCLTFVSAGQSCLAKAK